MNKNFKVFQIHGLSGLFFLCFVFLCLFFGFILFPVWAVMVTWNEIISGLFHLPAINCIQASLLWAIVILSFYLIFKNSVIIKIHTSDDDLSDSEINEIMHEIEEKNE